MRHSIKNFVLTALISVTAFLVGCSGCVSKAGDKVVGSGTGTVNPTTGAVAGSGTGTATSQTNGTNSGTQNNGSTTITMQNPSDKIVCTSSTGVVTVYNQGQTITSSGTSTCVDTPANQVPAGAIQAGSSGSGTGTTTTGSGTNTTTTGSATDSASKAKNSF
jgi:hypothetical protein